MLTTVPFLVTEVGDSFGRPGDELVVTTTMDSLSAQQLSHQSSAEVSISAVGQHQQQVVDGNFANSFFSMAEINHWTPANCTALIHALLASFSVILVSELGDKTFIITAIMAMKNSRSLVFISSVGALFLMTVLSVGMGVAVTVIPKLYTHYVSIVLFLCFGLKMLKEAYDMRDESEESEFDEVKRELEEGANKALSSDNEKTAPTEGNDSSKAVATKTASGQDSAKVSLISKLMKTMYVAPIVIKVSTMVFVAEWGDRSQISTVILAAREDVVGVFMGSFFGHVLCTGLAVVGGRFFAELISVKTMTLLGGITFLLFAAFAIVSGTE